MFPRPLIGAATSGTFSFLCWKYPRGVIDAHQKEKRKKKVVGLFFWFVCTAPLGASCAHCCIYLSNCLRWINTDVALFRYECGWERSCCWILYSPDPSAVWWNINISKSILISFLIRYIHISWWRLFDDRFLANWHNELDDDHQPKDCHPLPVHHLQ